MKNKIYEDDTGSNYKFQMGLILGIASTVNLFISFIEKEFSLIWISISILFLALSNIWLLKRKINLDSDNKELYFAKHGVWRVGLLVILFGFFKNGITVNYVLVSVFIIILKVQLSYFFLFNMWMMKFLIYLLNKSNIYPLDQANIIKNKTNVHINICLRVPVPSIKERRVFVCYKYPRISKMFD